MAANTCRNHPAAPALYICRRCQAPICEQCTRTTDDQQIVCIACAQTAALEPLEELAEEPAAPQSPVVELAPVATYDLGASLSPPAPARARGTYGKCVNHPDAEAWHACANCRSAICTTCDFPFPGGIHLCPACATNPKQGLTPKRKQMAITSFVLAVLNVLGSGFCLLIPVIEGVRNQESLQALGCVVMLVLVSAVVGAVLGFTVVRRRSRNPILIWIGPVLNGLIALIWLGLMVLGNMRR